MEDYSPFSASILNPNEYGSENEDNNNIGSSNDSPVLGDDEIYHPFLHIIPDLSDTSPPPSHSHPLNSDNTYPDTNTSKSTKTSTTVPEQMVVKQEPDLGDFGSPIWQYLEIQKEKWKNSSCNSNSKTTNKTQSKTATTSTTTTLVDLSDVLNSGSPIINGNTSNNKSNKNLIKQPPLLPHSSSSEYSSEEELLLAGHHHLLHNTPKVVMQQAKKKKVTFLVLQPNTNKSNDKKTLKKKSSKAKVRISSSIKEKSNHDAKDIHFEDQLTKEIIPNNNGGNNNVLGREKLATPIKQRIPIPISISTDPIHVFVDNSNILVGFLAYCREKKIAQINAHGVESVSHSNPRPQIDYEALFTILERGRKTERKILVASSPLYQSLEIAENGGYEVSVLRRVKRPIDKLIDPTINEDSVSNTFHKQELQQPQKPPRMAAAKSNEMEKEQCVDELLHLKILESLLDYSAPTTLVLASGDGKDSEYFQGGFHKCVVRALERGWKVEVISWQRQLSHNFLDKKFLKKWEGRYYVVFLDWFAKELGSEF
ncbi:12120_t:CDS:2 [Ambispora leptoticha]|uniref:12120_t:CDS:1 n=1 Tax=Ambispora leptoticha TaxID=144679 RepID=A0A9N9BIJ0_9GLOM|nr:12120_t:CDS:2 [Ambispora leptoticha]